jgi:Domain of unknown function (DUF6456)
MSVEPVDVERVVTVTYNEEGKASRSITDRRLGVIERMAKRGAISDQMAEAAVRFSNDFLIAALQPMRAASLRERTDARFIPQEISWRATRARGRVMSAMRAVGEPGGSCMWAVLGEEHTLKEWALTARVSDENATGVLIGALGTLKAHYRM